jgi:hypothetical protein
VSWWKCDPQFKTLNCEIRRKKRYANIEKLEQQKKMNIDIVAKIPSTSHKMPKLKSQ